jgi:DNA-binding helix-hairpin-helix protein with protein kinase domain
VQLVTNVLQEKKVFMDKSYIFLKSPIGSGGEANIYTVRIRPDLVAKVYHQPHGEYARKLAFMIANPPVDPLASSGRDGFRSLGRLSW